MIFKSYLIWLVSGLCLIVITSIIAGIQINEGDKPYTILVLVCLVILEAWFIVHENNRINTQLRKFFDAFRNNDNTVTLQSKNAGKSFAEVTRAMNDTLAILKDARFEKEKQFRFLRFISDQVGLGILVFNRNNETVLYNNAITRELGISEPTSLILIGKRVPGLADFLNSLRNGESRVYRNPGSGRNILLVRASYYTPADESLRLYVFQDLRREMEDTEMETWHKMIRVLSHEIMNSVTPVINLTSASRKSMERIRSSASCNEQVSEELNDVIFNNEIIGERMKGLSEFVIRYKKASSIPAPEICMLNASEIISGVITLMKEELEIRKIDVKTDFPDKNLSFDGDQNLIGQVLINVIRNSIEASENSSRKEITVEGRSAGGKAVISITDKGEGIPKENIDRIFLPFFTTRKNGSGIGLSLSRQIVRMHGGSLQIWSEEGNGTTVEIVI
ncbi:MAG TPA: HAMP domain-containing sensor histidine kinase [Bacteroidales bacterium]|nr:HAMP domain-containing sensor histidine kinase [Bacteroidales bacterium]